MNTKTFNSPYGRVISQHQIANVLESESTRQKCLLAAVSFLPGDVITSFNAGSTQSFATYLTIQIGSGKHITLLPEFVQYINHSCAPTAFFNTTTMELVCIIELKAGDEITFFYPSTEWEMAQPFVCNCESTECLQLINGASHLSVETLSKYKLTHFIMQQVKQKFSM